MTEWALGFSESGKAKAMRRSSTRPQSSRSTNSGDIEKRPSTHDDLGIPESVRNKREQLLLQSRWMHLEAAGFWIGQTWDRLPNEWRKPIVRLGCLLCVVLIIALANGLGVELLPGWFSWL